jgi:hypothetical protein
MWHTPGSGPRTQSSRAWFLPYSGTKSDVPELTQRAGGLNLCATTFTSTALFQESEGICKTVICIQNV